MRVNTAGTGSWRFTGEAHDLIAFFSKNRSAMRQRAGNCKEGCSVFLIDDESMMVREEVCCAGGDRKTPDVKRTVHNVGGDLC